MPELQRPIVVAIAAITAAVVATITSYTDEYIEPSGIQLYEYDRHRGPAWVINCLGDDTQLFAESRLRKPVFEALAGWLRGQGVCNGKSSVEEKLLIFLYICGNGASWRNTRYRCGRSLDTISK